MYSLAITLPRLARSIVLALLPRTSEASVNHSPHTTLIVSVEKTGSNRYAAPRINPSFPLRPWAPISNHRDVSLIFRGQCHVRMYISRKGRAPRNSFVFPLFLLAPRPFRLSRTVRFLTDTPPSSKNERQYFHDRNSRPLASRYGTSSTFLPFSLPCFLSFYRRSSHATLLELPLLWAFDRSPFLSFSRVYLFQR